MVLSLGAVSRRCGKREEEGLRKADGCFTMLGQRGLHLSQVLTFHGKARPRLPGCTGLKDCMKLHLRHSTLRPFISRDVENSLLAQERIFGSVYWQNTPEYEPPSPHTKVRSVLVSEGWAKAVRRGVGERGGGGLCLAVVLLKVGLFLSHKVCKNVPMLCPGQPPAACFAH